MWFHALITMHDSRGRPSHGASSLHYNRHFHHKQQPWCKRHIALTLQEKMCREKLYTEKRTQDIAKKMDIALFINSYRTMVSLHSHTHTHTKKKDYIVIETSNGLRCIHSHWQYYSRSTAPARQRKIKANRRLKKKQTGPHMAPYNCCGTSPKSNYFFTHWLLQTSRGDLRKQDDTGGERKKNKQRQRRQLCHETQWRTNPTCVGSARVQRAKRGQNNRCLSKARCWFPASLRGIAVRWRKIVYICRLEDFFRPTSCQWKCARDRICTTPVSAPWSSSTHTELTMSKGSHWNIKQLILNKA